MSERVCRSRGESGYVAILVSILIPVVFMGLAAISVDVARWYVEIERVQKAADAAALAAVTYMPNDMDNAEDTAKEVSSRNGFPDSGTSSVVVGVGDRSSQLKVTVSSTVKNAFASALGFPTQTLTRSAVADYTGPAPMGSPCNTFGNEPDGSPGAGPIASQLAIPTGGADCPRFPKFWMSVHGPRVYKTQGDEYHTRVCSGTESDCTGSVNDEHRPEGYFMIVRVLPAAVGQPIQLQIYDPAYVSTDSTCDEAPTGIFPLTDDWNPYATTDARTRYAKSAGLFCTGDNNNSGQRVGSETATVTSFGMRSPVDTFDPEEAIPMPACAVQYPGYTYPSVGQLTASSGSYNQSLARVFHQWVDLCTTPFVPTQAGDYYLQVRTNVALGGSANDGNGGYRGSGNNIFTQAGDDTGVLGNGSNRFAVRAVSTVASSVSVAGWERMPIFANADSANPIFNLIRVLPAAVGKSLEFKFFDVGDAAANGTVTVLRPVDATGGPLTGCTGSGKYNGDLPNCEVTGINSSSGWNGQAQVINVPIPADYDCAATSPGGCWFRVQVSFGTGSVTDATTWTANVRGNPVRLVE